MLNADGFDAGELANVRDSFAKGSSNDYDITPKELDSRRIPESGCRVLEDYFRQQYDWTMTVDEARLVKFRVSFTGELMASSMSAPCATKPAGTGTSTSAP